MKSSLRFLLVIFALALSGSGRSYASSSLLEPENLRPWLESERLQNKVPALAVAIVSNGKIATLATGLRKLGAPSLVTDDDNFHLGSCTKAMTATLLAYLVEDGKLKWDATLAQIYPELADGMRPEYRNVTLRQVLNQRAGLPASSWPAAFEGNYWRQSQDPLPAQRLAYVKAILAEASEAPVGTKFIYSNRNYILAGAIAEHVTGQSWEELMQQRIFKPLQMTSAGFGPTASQGKLDGVWAHSQVDTSLIPRSGPLSDNPAVLGPAGTVHCSMADWGKFARFILEGAAMGTKDLSQANFAALTVPPPGTDYAFGWQTMERKWGGGTVLQHAGSNTGNYCVAWLAPNNNFAVLVATNSANGAKVCDEVAGVLAVELNEKLQSAQTNDPYVKP